MWGGRGNNLVSTIYVSIDMSTLLNVIEFY
jgi:hypothetical protein